MMDACAARRREGPTLISPHASRMRRRTPVSVVKKFWDAYFFSMDIPALYRCTYHSPPNCVPCEASRGRI